MTAAMVDFERLNQLAPLAKSGDATASDELMTLAYPLVDFVIRQNGFFLPRTDPEDLRQEGMIGVFEALEGWDPEQAPFAAFAVLCVRRELISVIKTANREKRLGQNEAISLDAPAMRDKHGHEDDTAGDRLSRWDLPDTSGLGADPAEVACSDEPSDLRAELMRDLSQLECDSVARCLAGEETYHQAASTLGVTAKSVDNALVRAKRKIVRRATELVRDSSFTGESRCTLANIARLAAGPHRKVTDEELRAALPIELLRPAGLARFSRTHQEWTLPPARLMAEYPDIASFASSEIKQAVLAHYLEGKPWKEIAASVGSTISACKHHLRRTCEAAAKAHGVHRLKRPRVTPLYQRVEQLWLKGLPLKDIETALAGTATAAEIQSTFAHIWQRHQRAKLRDVPQEVQTRRIPLVRLNRIPALVTKARPLLCPEYLLTLKLYMQGYSHPEIAERRNVAPSCIGKNDLPVIRRALRGVSGFEWLYDPQVRERQIRLLALESLGITAEQALQRIPPHHREMFALYLAGLAYRDIDCKLSLKPGSAEKLLHYCRSCLRREANHRDHLRRRNIPERDAGKHIRRDPEMYRRFLQYGHLLDPSRRQLLTGYYQGLSTTGLILAAGEEPSPRLRSRFWARIGRAGALLQKIEREAWGSAAPQTSAV